MKTLRLILAFLAAISVQVQSQSNISISRPELTYYNDTLVILFDIRGCSQNNIFNIYPHITYPNGEAINTSALQGDIGDSIRCGQDKRIVWNLAADNIRINGNIEVQITAKQVVTNDIGEDVEAKAKDEVATTEEKKGMNLNEEAGEDPDQEARIDIKKHADDEIPGNSGTILPPSYSRGNIMASSLILPGLGQKKASSKGAHLLLGVIGYGSLAASGYFIYDYNNKYDQYLEAVSVNDRDRLFRESEKSYNMARYLVFSAAGVWALNLIWSAIIPSSPRNNFKAGASANKMKGVNIYATWKF
ncbi:MAG TPA: hypothetical protein VJ877_00645 [Bacteroidales bacterium]|nr:hypothetical protein [Bacteroidales bacterium]